MRAVITAGGTAGHVNPALAIADEIMMRDPSSEVTFIGRKDGIEKTLVERAGYRLIELEVHGFMRSFSPADIAFNMKAAVKALSAYWQAKKQLRSMAPDIVVGCGGYVSGPVIRAAADIKLRTVIQEQNSYPGLTTRLLAKCADLIFCADETGARFIGFPQKTIVSGNPVRQDFFDADPAVIRERWNVGDRTFVLSYGGSNGSAGINRVAAAFMKRHWKQGSVFHAHATGAYAKNSFSELMTEFEIDYENSDAIKVFEYIEDMPSYYAASDLIISRAGALTIAEIQASGKASVLLPSPNVTDNHQFFNAMLLSDCGAALVYEQKDADAETIADRLMQLIQDHELLKRMGDNAKASAIPGAAGTIYTRIRAFIDGE